MIDEKKKWEERISKLKNRFSILLDGDYSYEKGKEQSMLRIIEYKLRKTTEELEVIMAKF